MILKPKLMNLWNAFPDHTQYPTLKDLYEMLGGTAAKNIYVPGFGPKGNTCASRMSVALNKGGSPISRSVALAAKARTISAADNSQIIFGVADLRNYLLHTLGKPQIDSDSPFDSAFRGKKGIIAFSVNWSDATGHIALWNGANYREPAHDDYSTFVSSIRPSIRTSRAEFWSLS
jgi:hypothetical protein